MGGAAHETIFMTKVLLLIIFVVVKSQESCHLESCDMATTGMVGRRVALVSSNK